MSGKYKIPLNDCARAAGGVSARAIHKHFFASLLSFPFLKSQPSSLFVMFLFIVVAVFQSINYYKTQAFRTCEAICYSFW